MLASSHSPAPSLTTSTLSLTRQHLPLPLALAMPPQDLAAPLFPLRAPLTAPGGSEDRRRKGLRRGYSASGDVDLRRTWWRCPVSSLSLSLLGLQPPADPVGLQCPMRLRHTSPVGLQCPMRLRHTSGGSTGGSGGGAPVIDLVGGGGQSDGGKPAAYPAGQGLCLWWCSLSPPLGSQWFLKLVMM